VSQKATVLKMLRNAGERGVRSDAFYREFLGRGVARIYDLRQDGYEISSEKEGKYTRYKLQEQRGVTSRRTTNTRGVEGNPDSGRAAAYQSQPLDMKGQRVPSSRVTRAEVPAAAPEALFDITPPSAYDPYSEAA
jgi:hypothetical protein